MDLFEVYPELQSAPLGALEGRALRLIAISGFVYDQQAFYFELGERKFWARGNAGQPIIGVGTPRVTPTADSPPYRPLLRYLRKQWRAQVALYPAGHTHVIDEEHEIGVIPHTPPTVPYLLALSPPRLGGGEMPDALVQGAYLLPVEKLRLDKLRVNLLRVARTALIELLEGEALTLAEVCAQPWAMLYAQEELPQDAAIRPVLTLRSLGHFMEAGVVPLTEEAQMESGDG